MTFKELLKNSVGLILVALCLSLAGALATLAQPSLVGALVESIGKDSIIQPTVYLLVMILVAAIMSGLQTYVTSLAADRTIVYIRTRLAHHLLRLPLQIYDKQGSGAFVTRLTSDTSVVSTAFSSALVECFGGGFVVLGVIVYMAYIDPALLAVVIFIITLSILIVAVIAAKLSSLARDVQDRLSEIGSLLQSTISAMRTVKSLTAEDFINKKLNKKIDAAFISGKQMSKIESILTPVGTVTVYTSLVLVLMFGANRVNQGLLTPTNLIVFITALFLIVAPISQITDAISSFREASGAFKRIQQVLAKECETHYEPDRKTKPLEEGEQRAFYLRFDGVYFSYGASRALRDVSFEVLPGEKVAIVGESGSGKTSLLSLPLRLYDADSGKVVVNYKNVNDWNLDELRRNISYIEQEPMLVPGRIKDNLVLGLEREVKNAELIRALEGVGLIAFANKKELERKIYFSGSGVSGGERQRLAIARAIIRNSPLVIVDEPTSSLDEHSRNRAIESLLSTSATVLFSTHDLSIAVKADRVITLSAGTIKTNTKLR